MAEYGYALERTLLDLPQAQRELERLQDRRSRLEEVLPYLDLTKEQSRREMLIAPLMEERKDAWVSHTERTCPRNRSAVVRDTTGT